MYQTWSNKTKNVIYREKKEEEKKTAVSGKVWTKKPNNSFFENKKIKAALSGKVG